MVSVGLVVTAYSTNRKSGAAGVDEARLLLLLAVLLRNTIGRLNI